MRMRERGAEVSQILRYVEVELHLGLSLDTETLMKACHSQSLHPLIDLLVKYRSSENY